jgi:CheY-like chemotaxis protein
MNSQMARHILVVEDDASVLKSISRRLRLLGFEVCPAMTAAEAIEKLNGHTTVVIDLNLPDAPGAAVLRKIRESNLPIRAAIWTATPEQAAIGELAALKPDAVFHKMEIDQLLAWIGSTEST